MSFQRQLTTLTILNRFHSSYPKFKMKLSLPLLFFAVLETIDVVAGKKKVTQSSRKLRGNKNNALRNQDNKLDAVPSRVESERNLQHGVATKMVGGNKTRTTENIIVSLCRQDEARSSFA